MFTRPFFVERETIAVALLFIKWTLHGGAGANSLLRWRTRTVIIVCSKK